MKKLLAAICSLAVLACGALAFAGCGDTIGIPDEEGYTIKIGYTEYAPMNYYEGGKFVGYDTEFAIKLCEDLGYNYEFVLLNNWATKVVDLEAGTIDLIWNGMTITDDLKESILISDPYMTNQQVLVGTAENLAKYDSVESLANVGSIAYETGSAAEALVGEMFSAFDPDLKITAVQGKTFSLDSAAFADVRRMPEVAVFTEVVEENALVSFKNKHIPATVKGVDERCFREMTRIDSILYDGEFVLFDGGFERIVPGVGVASSLGLGAHFIDPVYLYAPKRTAKVNMLRPENSFNRVPVFVSGIFMVQQQPYDDSYVLVSLNRARELFEYDERTVSAVELKLASDADVEQVKTAVKQLLGDGFAVKNRYEQQESFFKIMKMEKWITYLFLSLILLIASFNILGSLSMLIIDKQADIVTLSNLGADRVLIKRIFLFEGWLISVVGALSGIMLGTVLCLLQQHFGFLRMGNGYIADALTALRKLHDITLSRTQKANILAMAQRLIEIKEDGDEREHTT